MAIDIIIDKRTGRRIGRYMAEQEYVSIFIKEDYLRIKKLMFLRRVECKGGMVNLKDDYNIFDFLTDCKLTMVAEI